MNTGNIVLSDHLGVTKPQNDPIELREYFDRANADFSNLKNGHAGGPYVKFVLLERNFLSEGDLIWGILSNGRGNLFLGRWNDGIA